MSMTQSPPALKTGLPRQHLDQLVTFVQTALHRGDALHASEDGIWTRLLQLGQHLVQQVFDACGPGDLGATLRLPDGREVHRLPERHSRRYVSIFGPYDLERVVYGSREGQPLEFIPLDTRLQLPASAYSYLLQDWDQALAVEQAFGQVNATLARMLHLQQAVDSLEHMNREMAAAARPFRLNRPAPPAAEEGEVVVVSADQKGVVLRRPPDDPAPPAHRTKGDKASRKRMATVGAIYTVDRHVRTPEEVVAALFRDDPGPPANPARAPRPRPQHKQVWASLPVPDGPASGLEAVFLWLLWEVVRRNPGGHKETVYLSDGQEALWEAQAQYFGGRRPVGILDLLHVTPRLWQAAHVFHPEKSTAAEAFVRERVLRVLRGEVAGVIHGLRVQGGLRSLTAAKRQTLRAVCQYLEKNQGRMRYDAYLAAGYPIASGVIEGACRHLVKDRMERAGMHWTVSGAQAMLEVRSVFLGGQWDEFQQYRIECETQRLYPYWELVEAHYGMAV